MVVVPAAMPLTIPVDAPIVAVAVLSEDQMPPVVELPRVVVLDGHSTNVPVMVPAFGVGVTVMT
jgi:hypothetical protein